VTVVATAARQANLPVYLDAIGTVTPVYTDLISSQVTGQVVAVHYKEGQIVHRGAPLVEIDPRPFEATLLQAQGALERDTQVLAQARMDLARYRAAWAKRAIAKQQLDDQEKLVLQTEGTVKNDRGTVRFDQVQLDFCHITAPITGRVGLRLIDPGNVVNAGSATTLAVITQLQPISVVFTVSEDDLGPVLEQTRRGGPLRVDALDRVKSRRLASGTLLTIDNQIDTTTGTVKLRALFDNQDELLFPNQFVNTRLVVRTVEAATTLPSSAVQHDGEDTFVYVIEAGHARVRHVKAGLVEGDLTEVDGIAPGTLVANGSFEKLQDGAPVTIVNRAAAAPPGTGGLGRRPRR
jgi:multidrug efflux system membrane fusion protein